MLLEMVPITGRVSSFLEFFLYVRPLGFKNTIEHMKRAKHSQVCSIKNRDIYIYIYMCVIVCMSLLPFDL